MSDSDLGTARGKIILETDLSALDTAESKMTGFGTTSQKTLGNLGSTLSATQRSLNLVGNAALASGAAVVGGFGIAVKSASDYQHELSAIQAVSGATDQQMQDISKSALQLGKDTVFSASEAAQAYEELVKAGVSVKDALGGAAAATVNLAAAGGIDLPTAANLAAQAMNAFGLSAKDLTGVTNDVAGAANASAIDVGQFAFSLSQVGAVAHLAGLSFHDTSVAIAEMGNAGIVGSDAGTSLKQVLLNLIPTTKKQIAVAKTLGIVTADGANQFFDASGKAKNLAGIQDVLQKSTANLTQEQKLYYLGVLFGSDAIRGATVLANQGAAGYDAMNAAIGNVTAQEVATTRMNNLAGQTEQLKGSAETLAIMIGQILIPNLLKLVTGVTGVLNKFIDLSDGTKKVITDVGLFGGTLLLVIGILAKVVAATLIFRQAILDAAKAEGLFKAGIEGTTVVQVIAAAATDALGAALNRLPLIIIVTLISLLIAAYVDWVRHNADAQKSFEPVIAALKDLAATITPAATELTKGFAQIAKTLTSALIPVFETLTQILVAVLVPVIKLLTQILDPLVKIIGDVLGAALGIVVPLLAALAAIINVVLKILQPFIDLLLFLVNGALQPIIFILDLISKAFDFLGAVFTKVFGKIQEVLAPVGAEFKKLYDEFIGPFVAAFQAGVQKVEDKAKELYEAYIKPVFSKIVAALQPLWDRFKTVIESGISKILQEFGDHLETLLSRAQAVWDKLKPMLQPIIDAWKKGLKDELEAALQIFIAALEIMYQEAKDIWDGMKLLIHGLADIWHKDVDAATAVIQPFIDVYENVKNKTQEVVDKIKGHWADIKAAIQPDIDKIKGSIESIHESYDRVKGSVDLAVGSIEESVGKINTALQPLKDAIKKIFDAIFGPAGVPATTQTGMDGVSGAVDGGATTSEGRLQKFLDVVTGIANLIAAAFTILAGIISAVASAINIAVFTITTVINSVAAGVQGALQGMSGFFTTAGADIAAAIKTIKDTIGTIEATVKDQLSGAEKWLLGVGKSIIDGLKTGIENAIPGLKTLLQGITTLIPKNKGPESVDKVLLTDNGKMIMQSLLHGLQSQVGDVTGFLNGLNTSIPSELNAQLSGQSGSSYSNSRSLTYVAAPNQSLDSEEDLYTAMRRSKVLVPGW